MKAISGVKSRTPGVIEMQPRSCWMEALSAVRPNVVIIAVIVLAVHTERFFTTKGAKTELQKLDGNVKVGPSRKERLKSVVGLHAFFKI